jgi:hypothetical protein
VRAKRAPDSRFAREAAPWQPSRSEASKEQQGIELDGIEIPKKIPEGARARASRAAHRAHS